ncbi:MAG: glutamate formimidoyltransferase [Stomatobaculum sp.]|nr:glutamate formimidoyltransferase [Stomatobaculum sp.]
MQKQMLIQSIPNFSEGRDLKKVEQIVDAFRGRPGLKLLDYSTDPDHNRSVAVVIGGPEAMKEAMVDAIGRSIDLIDMNIHEGKHPRIGCVDVIPFIPVRGATLQDADALAKEVAQRAAEQFSFPFYLYEASASAPHRVSLSDIRAGQYEGLAGKMKDPLWIPDYGPASPHPTGGAAAIGARMPIIYYNVNLDTSSLETARSIARKIRGSDGGYRFVKAMGIVPEGRNSAQVSVNLTDFSRTSLYTVFETVKMEAARYGVRAVSSEVVGYLPLQALVDSAEYYLQLEDFSPDQILEYDIWNKEEEEK